MYSSYAASGMRNSQGQYMYVAILIILCIGILAAQNFSHIIIRTCTCTCKTDVSIMIAILYVQYVWFL